MTCPIEDKFCVSYESTYFEYDEGQEGNVTRDPDAGWNMVRGIVIFNFCLSMDVYKKSLDVNLFWMNGN